MRRVILVCVTLWISQVTLAQSYAISEIAPVAGVSFYSLGGTSIAGPSIAV